MPRNPARYRVVIVNNSPEDTGLYELESRWVKIIEAGHNLGFGCACNLGLRWVYERDPNAFVWIINPDAYLLKNPLDTLEILFRRCPELSIVGTVVKTFDGGIWFAGGQFRAETGSIRVQETLPQSSQSYWSCDWVSGCSLIINLKHFSDCPQFSARYFLYYEDFEFCRRYAAAGHVVAMTQAIAIFHEPSSITNRNLFLKMRHSTFSYLLTLEEFASPQAFTTRLVRLLFHALYLMAVKPQTALGKLYGLCLYGQYRLQTPAPPAQEQDWLQQPSPSLVALPRSEG